jgi:hypothetical protein
MWKNLRKTNVGIAVKNALQLYSEMLDLYRIQNETGLLKLGLLLQNGQRRSQPTDKRQPKY